MDVVAKAVLDQLMQQDNDNKYARARAETKMINKRDGDKTYADRRRRRMKMMRMKGINQVRLNRVDPAPFACSCEEPQPMGKRLPRVCSR